MNWFPLSVSSYQVDKVLVLKHSHDVLLSSSHVKMITGANIINYKQSRGDDKTIAIPSMKTMSQLLFVIGREIYSAFSIYTLS